MYYSVSWTLDLSSQVDEKGIPMEIKYSIKRLIQGLGSSRASIRKSYFASLVSLLRKSESAFGSISLSYFKELVDAQLSKFDSKGVCIFTKENYYRATKANYSSTLLIVLKEEGEVLSGKILAYGVAMRSKIILNGPVELQQAVLSEILTSSKERSYLPLLAYTFIMDFIKSVSTITFFFLNFLLSFQ